MQLPRMKALASPRRDTHFGQSPFVTTRWTVVVRAGGESADAEAALAQLCRDYWYPLYAFARRRGLTGADGGGRAGCDAGIFFARDGSWDAEARVGGAGKISDVPAGGDAELSGE